MALEDDIRTDLKRQGYCQSHTSNEQEAKEWRTAARSAARSLKRPVRTHCVHGVLLANLTDWPANELEQQLLDAQMRNAMSRAHLSESLELKTDGEAEPARPPIPLPPRTN